ncbi:MAG: hypothetical protein mread185_000137 [Mycoplasmataceae bacterium]|nr:MAG: hypothetical protein mread185_000137 [Mycoplasmataceae bacterium]
MKLNEIKDIKSVKNESDNSLIRNLLFNQRTLGEELLEEKKERLTRLEKELSEAKTNFLNNCSSNSLVTTNSSSRVYCSSCGSNHCRTYVNNGVDESKKINENHLEVALICKQFLLEDKCNELAEKLFNNSFRKIESFSSTKAIFDLTEKIHKCKESIKILEKSIADSELQEQKLEAKVEVLTK